jgi:gluconokinase
MLVVVIGVAGSGKTTVGTLLAGALGSSFLDADSLHSEANIAKMARGLPLTETDREPWLTAIHARLADAHRRGASLVVACSALTRRARTVLGDGLPVHWVWLDGPAELIWSRVQQRAGHYMKTDMLASQFETWEAPDNAVVVDVSLPPDAIVERILAALPPSHS